MQKVVDFLERYCHWIAVAIGALFFLFALYQYLPVVSTPVTLTLGDKKLTPGEIDREIVQNVADPLETRMSDPGKPTITVPNYTTKINEQMSVAPKLPSLSPAMVAAKRVELPDLPWDAKPVNPDGPVAVGLVELPSAILDPKPTTGFAQVTPVIAQPGGAPPVANPAGGTLDVTWVRVPFTISMGQMDRAFRAANIPGALANTNFIRVDLVRQRQLPNGNWAAEEVVAPIETAGIVPFPANQQNPAVLIAHNQWAIQHQQQIVQPPFYPFVAGDHPFRVEVTPAAIAAGGDPALAGFEAETYPPNGPLDTLTPEQKKAVIAVRQRRAKEAEDARRSQGGGVTGGQGGSGARGGGGGRGPGGGGGGPGGRSNDGTGHTGTATPWQAVPGGGYPGGGYPGGGYPGGGYPGGGYPGEGGMMPGGPQTNEITIPQIQNTPFIPQAGVPDIQGYAFDMTAKAGATYHYRVRYSIYNPLFNATIAGVPPQILAQLEIFGEDRSKWSESITVKSNTHVFLQSAPSLAGSLVRFTVFHWQNGKWNRANQTFSPGDSVGKIDAEIDYRSNYTLVDVRKDSTSDRAYALLMVDDGSIVKRDYETDKDSQDFKDLNLAVDGPPVAPVSPEGGYPGGGYPGGGYPGGGYPGAGMPGGPAVP